MKGRRMINQEWRCSAASALVEPSRGLVGQRRRFRMGENLEAAGEQRHRRGRLPIPGIRSEADQPFQPFAVVARGGGGDEGSWRNFKLRESAKEKIFIERFHLAR